MEKSTDSTSSTASSTSSSSAASVGSTAAGSSSNITTTNCSDGNEHQQKQNQMIKNTPTKNQVNNSLGCGPSLTSSSVTISSSSNSLLLNKGAAACGVVGNNLKSNANSNNKMSFNNTSTTTIINSSNTTTLLGHQSSSKNNNSSNTTSISNNAGSAASVAAVVASTLSNLSTSGSSNLAPASISSTSSAITTTSATQMAPISLNISTTTGGNFSVSVDPLITVENLKKIIAKKLKVAKDRICLLHREKELQDGLLKENNLMDGSKIILIPNVETGLLAQRPENTVMQALESLNDSQVNDFLSGKTPLNLSMRLGDHMMLIQLQLSTVNPVNGVAHNGANCSSSSSRQRSSHHHHHHHRSSRTSSAGTQNSAGGSSSSTTANHSHHHHHHHHHHHGATVVTNGPTTSTAVPTTSIVGQKQQNITAVRKLELDTTSQTARNILTRTSDLSSTSSMLPATTSASTAVSTKHSDLSSLLSKRDFESLQNIVKSFAMAQPSVRLQRQQPTITTAQMPSSSSEPTGTSTNVPVVAPTFHNTSEAVLLEQSPIKSLSNLVSSPIKTTAIKNIPNISNNSNSNSGSNSSSIATNNADIETHVASSSAICQDPIAAKLTSCLCTRLNGSLNTMTNISHASTKQCIETACISSQQQQQQQPLLMQPHTTRTSTTSIMTSSNAPNCKATLTPVTVVNSINGSTISSSSSTSKSSSSLHKIAFNPIARKHRHHHHHHHHHHHYHHSAAAVQQLNNMTTNQKMIVNTSTPIKTVGNDSGFSSTDDASLNNSSTKIPALTSPAVAVVETPLATSSSSFSKSITSVRNPASTSSTATTATPIDLDDSGIVSDSRTLAEASRNLTQTLRKLSKEVFTNKIDFSASEETPRKSSSGAVIESMKNHGKGIYSGTFSGTLNPALQDRYGRPKRDISTVIHILNDLLSATPQYHRGARISFEAPSTSAAGAASVAAASGSTGTVHHSSRSKHLSSKHHQTSSQPCAKCIKTHSSSSSTVNLQCASNANATGTSLTSSTVCTYGECNGHYVSSKSQSNKIYTCCQQDITTTGQHSLSSSTNTAGTTATSNGHHHHHHATSSSSSHHHHHHHHQTADERRVCQCRYRIHSKTGERERDYTCPKCVAELDNIKTKSKLDQLRLVMQQRKQKREARKLKGAPYGARVVGTTTTATASGVTDSTASTLTASNSSITTPISVATSAATPSEVSPNHLVEEVDTAA